ncbi:unnamed protein product, partial [Ascophyllum nodosum]
PPQQPAPRPFSSFVRDQRYHDGNSTASHAPAPSLASDGIKGTLAAMNRR